MDNVWEKIKRSLKEGATLSMEKIEEYTKIGKLKVEEMAAKRKIERNFVDLGERLYDLLEEGKSSGVADDLAIKKSTENINALKAELVDISAKITEVTEAAKKSESGEEEDEVDGV